MRSPEGSAGERFYPDFASWSHAAASLLARRAPVAEAGWRPDRSAKRFPSPHRAFPKSFVAAARLAACHRSDDAWHLLYRCALRMKSGEPHLLGLRADPDVARLFQRAKSVRRDVHKMKAFVRFREVPDGAAEPRYVAWFEPDHEIVEYAAGFFRRRFANMRWSILTPDRCAHWEGEGHPWFSDGVSREAAPTGDRLEEAWRVYFRSIFNPARLKIDAMRSEMPQKYWHNLPEARLIPGLVREAGSRVQKMTERVKDHDALQCGPRPARPRDVLEAETLRVAPGSLHRLKLEAQACTACPLWSEATQAVFGEGPGEARLMLVGEQPGDHEDLQGRPFVGPAGRLLDRALVEAGIDRDRAYVTNAVKHFRYEMRGKRRLHKKPGYGHVQACSSWLVRELEAVDPEVVVCLGATAASAFLGPTARVGDLRGQVIESHGRRLVVTVHPSYLLRLPTVARKQEEYTRFVEDLRLAAATESVSPPRPGA